MSTPTRFARLARWSLTLAAGLMGVALLATVWTTHRAVNEASATLLRGQATVLHDHVKARLFGKIGEARDSDLAGIVDDLADDGLRYVALVDHGNRVISQGGKPSPDALAPGVFEAPNNVPVEYGQLAHVVFRRGPPPGALVTGLLERRRSIALVFEFEPKLANELRASSSRTAKLGALAGGGLLLVALGFVRWFLRREKVERQLAEERHLAALGRMSAVLAHEIRNPLASLKGNAQLLVRALPDGEKPRQKAQLLVEEAVRLETLTNDLLDFARTGNLALAETDPAALLREVAGHVDGERITIESDQAPDRWPLDAPRMRQVLTNLLENAVQAGEGPVVATVAREGGELAFEVRDHGPGVKEEDLPRLFEPFFTRRTRGTGLGLAIAKRLVEMHGGAIGAGNAVDGGAVFRVRLPRSGGG